MKLFRLTLCQLHCFRWIGLALCFVASASLVGCASAQNGSSELATNNEVADGRFFEKGPYTHTIEDTVWHDETRGRDIAVKLYVPDRSDPAPVVVFSHGLGGSTAAAQYLGEHFASWGIITLHIQHPGSDMDVWQGLQGRRAIVSALRDAATDPQISIDRFNDLPFVLDEIAVRHEAGELNVDLSAIGMAGHSFGAHSVLAAAGRRYALPAGTVSFADPRVKAAVALSPPAPGRRDQPEDYPQIYGDIQIPILHLTGTGDTSPLDRNQDPTMREIPFQYISGAPQYLVVFDGADHGVFGGQRLGRPTPDFYPRVQARVAGVSTTFFMAHLGIDGPSRDWLDGPGFLNSFSSSDRVDRK